MNRNVMALCVFWVFDIQRFRDVVATEGQITSRRIEDIDDEIAMYVADIAPITVITAKLAQDNLTDPKFTWMEQDADARQDAINNAVGYAAGDTALIVDHATYFNVGDIVLIERTGEHILVNAINDTTNTLTVVRAFGSTAAAAILDNDVLWIIGNAFAEGSDKANINVKNPVEVTNYAQIFKTSIGVTGTVMASKQRGGKELERQRLMKYKEHLKSIEMAFLYGEPKLYTTGEVRRTTGGLLYFCNQNIKDTGGATTWAEIEDFLQNGFAEGNERKVLFASPTVCTVLDQLAANKLQTRPEDQRFGIAVKTLVTSHGDCKVIKHKLLAGSVYGYYALLLDMDKIKMRTLRKTDLKENQQNPGQDQRIDQYLTECGLQVKLPKCHAILKNCTSAA